MDAKVVYVECGANDNYSIMMSGLFRQLLFGSGRVKSAGVAAIHC